MIPLNFPEYRFRFKNSENKTYVFDRIRKKFVVLQPEEWVRQHVVHFLIKKMRYPESLIQVEKQLIVNGLRKRYDIVVFNKDGSIFLIVECKAPNIVIDQSAFDQIARYNLALDAQNLMVTNGLSNYYCQLHYDAETYRFLKELPEYV